MLKILFFGDIAGEPGRKAVKKVLPQLLKEQQPDLVLANVEKVGWVKRVSARADPSARGV